MMRLPLTSACALCAALAMAPASQVAAAEFMLGVGADDGFRSGVPSVALEFRAVPRWRPGQADVGLGMAGEVDSDGDVWGGAGVVLTAPITPDWRIEASLMGGGYAQGSGGTDLGASFPIFRTQLGVSYLMASGWRVGAAINHKSNAGTASENPGVETVLVTFGRAF